MKFCLFSCSLGKYVRVNDFSLFCVKLVCGLCLFHVKKLVGTSDLTNFVCNFGLNIFQSEENDWAIKHNALST